MSDLKLAQAQLVTVIDWVRYAVTRFESAEVFYGHGTDNAWDEAVSLVWQALKLPFDAPEVVYSARLTSDECAAVSELIEKRVTERVPLPYLFGQAYYAGYLFKVDPRVLIPRSPLAEWIAKGFSPWLAYEPERVLDMCTGSGCLAVLLADRFPLAEVDAVDVSDDALQVAASNISRYGLDARVHLHQSDGFSNVASDARYDLIVMNPPYVGQAEYTGVPREFSHEPQLALLADNNGLKLAGELLDAAVAHLSEDGVLVLDMGMSAQAFMQAHSALPFVELDLEQGGAGILLVEAQALRQVMGRG